MVKNGLMKKEYGVAYAQWPGHTGSQIIPSPVANSVEFKFSAVRQFVPMNVHKFLVDLGWNSPICDPDTLEALYQKANGDSEMTTTYFRWYEAVAFEWMRMMTLGGE